VAGRDQVECREMSDDESRRGKQVFSTWTARIIGSTAAISMTLCEISKTGYSLIPPGCGVDDFSLGECLLLSSSYIDTIKTLLLIVCI
jgi:hypothetical protein